MDPQGAAMMNDEGVYNFADIWPGFQMNAGAASYGLGLDPMVMDQRSNHSPPNHNSRKRRDEDECAKGGASTSNSNGNSNNNAVVVRSLKNSLNFHKYIGCHRVYKCSY